MKKLFIVANWKSNKTESESIRWIQEFSRGAGSSFAGQISNEEKEIIVCPPFTLLCGLKSSVIENQLPFKVGGQDVSPFEEGAYTGEVSSRQIKEFGDYVIIGHSERRKNFKEDDAMLAQKVTMAKKYGLIPIFCVQNENTPIPLGATIVAYEPPSLIGTGIPDTPENADAIAKIIKEKHDTQYVLYGASVTSSNANSFTKMGNIDGVLVGGASLEAIEFKKIIENS